MRKYFNLLFPLLIYSSIAFGAKFQAGDITSGTIHDLNKNSGVASYYKDGKEGHVLFNCLLQPKNPLDGDKKVYAYVYGGKNFGRYLYPGTHITNGYNHFDWTLKDLNASNGNIKIEFDDRSETDATIQCQQVG